MMLEIRSFEGTPEELSEFVVSAWQSTYAGRMSVPHWSADYFRWQLRLDEPGSEKRIICAYEKSRPVGIVAHFPVTVELAGDQFPAAQGSWLSVPAEHRGQGIAKLLAEGARAALRQEHALCEIGYRYSGSSVSLGRKFWQKKKRSTTTFSRSVGFWARVLDPPRAADWNLNRWEGRMTRLAAPVLGLRDLRHPSGVVIRPVQPDDLPRCLELADKATQHCDLRIIWTANQLGRQLGLNGFGQALVAEVQGTVQGCLGFHTLPIQGHTLSNVGIIDLAFVSELTPAVRSELLNSVLLRLHQQDAVVALKLRGGDYPKSMFLKWGWVWKPADSRILITWADEVRRVPPVRKLHLLWR